MSIVQVECFTLICDGCGLDICEGGEHIGWGDNAGLEADFDEEQWASIDGKDYCFSCWEWNEDESDRVVKKDLPK